MAGYISSIGHLGMVVHPLDQLISGDDDPLADADSREGLALSQLVDPGTWRFSVRPQLRGP